jgi:hypothetical protein
VVIQNVQTLLLSNLTPTRHLLLLF